MEQADLGEKVNQPPQSNNNFKPQSAKSNLSKKLTATDIKQELVQLAPEKTTITEKIKNLPISYSPALAKQISTNPNDILNQNFNENSKPDFNQFHYKSHTTEEHNYSYFDPYGYYPETNVPGYNPQYYPLYT